MDDCYEQPADGTRAGYCSVCKQVKNIAKFDERMSRVTTSERGYAGAVRLIRERTTCSDCRPKKKPLAERTRKQLASMAAAGDIRRFQAEDIVHKKEQSLRDKQRQAGRKTAYNMHHKAKWQEISAALAKEQQAVRMQVYNLKRGGGSLSKPTVYAFAVEYLNALSRMRQMWSIDRNRLAAPPAHSWQDAIAEEVFHTLDAMWQAVPDADKAYPTRVPAFYERQQPAVPSTASNQGEE
jgi:hypothetical protein